MTQMIIDGRSGMGIGLSAGGRRAARARGSAGDRGRAVAWPTLSGTPRADVRGVGVRRRLAAVRWVRVLALLMGVSLLVGAGVAAVARAGAAPVAVSDGATVVRAPALVAHTVAPGETLWSLAVAAAPQSDPRETVDRIQRLNGLGGPQVQIGQVVLLPSAG